MTQLLGALELRRVAVVGVQIALVFLPGQVLGVNAEFGGYDEHNLRNY